ncbi:uncharacterized protein E0L32_003819 [Thyridium curvatum]|uniref:Dihydrodipicolinate synthase n=1 Tax=Thyridium curvatum TaxID=1093900 RepID=A0A507B0A6_9PEZI|nr:uncharacterized protein E0L32_003819 [Thyridium curvatum]TPX16525.1 hypothetical protein E0L32_003819 [Thyridium curvatum]
MATTPARSSVSSFQDGTDAAAAHTSSTTPPLKPGVYVPLLAFFTPDTEHIDAAATQRHAVRLANAGVAGLVLHGSNGEAAHLSPAERLAAIKHVADALRHDADHPLPIIAGCGAQSVRETVALCRDAHRAGATHALVLPPGYYAGLLKNAGGGGGGDAFVRFFHDVADASPIPVLVYNYPAAANGVDLDSDAVCAAARHPNVAGVKLTCGNTGKLARVAAATEGTGFFVAGGSADFILQGAVVGAHGTISGLANLAPRACVRVLELFEQGRLAEARRVQARVAAADWLAIQTGFVGVKAAFPMFHGEAERGCVEPRRPCLPMGEREREVMCKGLEDLLALEEELKAAGAQS